MDRSTTTILTAAAALAATAVLAAGFYGWLAHAPDLLLVYAERAVSWCF